jgi:hypothetical protein
MFAIVFKAAVVLMSGIVGAYLLRLPSVKTMAECRFLMLVIGTQAVVTLALFAAVYVVGHQQVTSDVPAYYVPAARGVIAGEVPYRDFYTSYAPLFPYVGAAILRIWDDPRAFVLLAILLNAATVVLWHAAARDYADRTQVRTVSILYITSGHVIVQCLLGSSQIWIAAALAASALLLRMSCSIGAGLVQAVSVCVSKVLAALYWPVLWVVAPHRWRWAIAAGVLSAVVYGLFIAQGADVLAPMRVEGSRISPGNLPYLLEPLLPAGVIGANGLFGGITGVVLGAVLWWLLSRAWCLSAGDRAPLLAPSLALVTLVFMLVSRKSFTGYVLFCMYPIDFVIAGSVPTASRRAIMMTVANLLFAIEPSVWFHLHGDGVALSAWMARAPGARTTAFVALDLALLACYGLLAWLSLQVLRRQFAIRASNSARSRRL